MRRYEIDETSPPGPSAQDRMILGDTGCRPGAIIVAEQS
jgi:hypothetical protein